MTSILEFVLYVHKVQIRALARRISVLHPRHKVDKGTIKIKNELTYARN